MPKRKIPYFVAHLTALVSEFISNNITHKKPVASLEGVRLAKAHLTFDSNKAINELGLPQTPIGQAILESADWLKKAGYLQ